MHKTPKQRLTPLQGHIVKHLHDWDIDGDDGSDNLDTVVLAFDGTAEPGHWAHAIAGLSRLGIISVFELHAQKCPNRVPQQWKSISPDDAHRKIRDYLTRCVEGGCWESQFDLQLLKDS